MLWVAKGAWAGVGYGVEPVGAALWYTKPGWEVWRSGGWFRCGVRAERGGPGAGPGWGEGGWFVGRLG